MAAILLGGGSVANRFAACAESYRQKAHRFQTIEKEVFNTLQQWQAMEASERAAAAKFRRGEWGLGEGKYQAEFENIINSISGPNSDAVANKLRKNYFESMARSCDESADSSHELAACFVKKAEYFAMLREKYENAARAPWWAVPPDPPEPR